MHELQHRKLCENLLLQACQTDDEIYALDNALNNISNNLDKYGLVDPYEATMSAEWYYNASKLISFPEDTIVVDCGCCCGLQQVFFNNFYEYIGIDRLNNFQKICNNAKFYNEEIETAVPKIISNFVRNHDLLTLHEVQFVGISSLCCSVFKSPRDVLYKYFDKVISL